MKPFAASAGSDFARVLEVQVDLSCQHHGTDVTASSQPFLTQALTERLALFFFGQRGDKSHNNNDSGELQYFMS
jgi:hypothetical protein